MRRFIFGNHKDIKKDSYIWNMVGGLLNAFQSVIVLMVLTRVLSIEDAGIFTIAWAIANLMITIGKYGVRNFQVTDASNIFSFNDYFNHRIVTSAAMIFCSLIYIIYLLLCNSYSLNKSVIVLLMCYLKIIDCFEDVFHGLYQKQYRLDIAGKCFSIRLIITIVTLCLGAIVFRNLVIASILSCITTTILLLYLLKITIPNFIRLEFVWNKQKVKRLLIECFPLFAGSFLSFYILNAPKYAIDALLSSELQAYYGFISMPVFVIGLLNNFAFQPILVTMVNYFQNGDTKNFMNLFWKQIIIIFSLTIITLIGSYLLGIPVLSFLYNSNLYPYKEDLLILMLGGGLLAYVGFLTTIITLLRRQNVILIGYTLGGVIAFLFSNEIVGHYHLRGASLLYLFLITILAIFFSISLTYLLKKGKEK